MQYNKCLKIVSCLLVAFAVFALAAGAVSLLVDSVMLEHTFDFMPGSKMMIDGVTTIRWMELGIFFLIVASLAFFVANCFVKRKMLSVSAIAVDGVLFAALFASLFIAKAAVFYDGKTGEQALAVATAFQQNIISLLVSSVIFVLADVARLVCQRKHGGAQEQKEGQAQ